MECKSDFLIKEETKRYSNGLFEYISGYVNYDSKCLFKCTKCNYVFESTFNIIKNRKKICRNCEYEQNKQTLLSKFNNIKIEPINLRNSNKLKCTCLNCGNIKILGTRNCNNLKSICKCYNKEEIYNKLKSLNLELITEFVDYTHNITVKCSICGTVRVIEHPKSLFYQKYGCASCFLIIINNLMMNF